MKRIPYGKQQITQEDIDAVVKVLESDWLTQGPTISAFEQQFAKYVGAKYAVAVANGTAALHLGAIALGVNKESRVITTPITFAASANCIRYCGGTVVLSDIDPLNGLLDLNKIRALLEKHPSGTFDGIIPVDFAGYPVDMEAFRALADEFGLWIMEDACHAPGATFTDDTGKVQQCGNGQFADVSVFSFHPVKHIACGEGGIITTNRLDLYERLLALRTHGIEKKKEKLTANHGPWYYEMQTLGFNYRLSDMQAALGISQLSRASLSLLKRREIAIIYEEAFKDLPIKTFPIRKGVSHAYHLYVIQTNYRKELYNYLRAKGVYAQVHYIPLHFLPYYQELGFRKGMFPQAEQYYEKCLSLPMYPSLKREEQGFVIDCIIDFFNEEVLATELPTMKANLMI